MSSTVALAARLRATPDDALTALLSDRQITPSGIHDYFDLAESLLTPDSLQNCLTLLDRQALNALTELSGNCLTLARLAKQHGIPIGVIDNLSELLLLKEVQLDDGGAGVTSYDEVARQLANWPKLGFPDAETLRAEPEPTLPERPQSHRTATNRVAAESAFSAESSVAELIFELEREPGQLLSRGDVGLPETRRLATAMGVDETAVPPLITIATRAGLLRRNNSRLVTTGDGTNWLGLTASQRWLQIAAPLIYGLPVGIRTHLATRPKAVWGEALHAWLAWNYPAGESWLRPRVNAYLSEAALLGITANSELSDAGAALLCGNSVAAAQALTLLLPETVDRVYLQNDLTVVSPGPLAHEIDSRLRAIADVESRTIASHYRMSRESISRAIARGETVETITSFLSEISLSGIPQPIGYLIAETAARHGLLRVGVLESGSNGAESYLRSSDTVLLKSVLVDRRLASLSLSSAAKNQLESKRDRDQVFWALVEARYPVAAEDRSGNVILLRRKPVVRTTSVDNARSPLAELVERLRLTDANSPADTAQAWLSRQLSSAIRNRLTLTVTVRMPNGELVDYLVEPTSLAGGRLRARDAVSEIERTLPMNSIIRIVEP